MNSVSADSVAGIEGKLCKETLKKLLMEIGY